MRLLPRSVRTQVTASIALVVMVVVALTGLAIALRIDHRDRVDIDRQLAERADKTRADADRMLAHPNDIDHGSDGDLLAGSQSLTRLLSGDAVLAERGERPNGPIPLPTANGLSTIEVGGRSWRSLVQPLDGVGEGRLQVLQDIEPVEQRLDDNGQLVAVVAALATMVTALGAWVVTGLVLQPLERLRVGARRIRPGDVGQRLPEVNRPQEVADLSATLNGMLERLQTSMLSTRRFTADASHELRTPLTSLGMGLETLRRNPDLPADQRDESLAAMAVEHHRMVALLDGLQALARGDAGALPARATVDLVDLAGEAVAHARHRHAQVTFCLSGDASPDELLVEGWYAGLRLALDNLLDNAALHGRSAGTVHVRLAAQDSAARLTVTDDGPGIPADQREAMKQRFARGAQPRSDGSGLGLALVEQQAVLHGGALYLDDSPGGGLRATLTLPIKSVRQ
jgi:signal transduction histidine kinase